jgi:glycosyltransferase involved in cell wall biosynthesis
MGYSGNPTHGFSVNEPATISVCVVCRNEADRLADCLTSVAWADELLVMDLESTDGSAELARAHGATVITRAPHPVVEPLRDEIAGHAHGTWLLVVDPDERVRPGLAEALRDAARRPDIDAVVLPRTNFDFGWAPLSPSQRYEPQLRMYRRTVVSWPHFPNRLPDVPPDRTLQLPSRDDLALEHDRNRSVEEAAARLVRYPIVQARAMAEEGRVFSANEMLRDLAGRAGRYFVDNRAWEEGVPGLVRAAVLLNYHVFVWVAFWQVSGAPRTTEDDRVVRRLGHALLAARTAARAAAVAARAAGNVRSRLP